MSNPSEGQPDQRDANRTRRWKFFSLWSSDERNRQGDDNTDNFVVLVWSLSLLAFIALGFATYYWLWPHAALIAPGGG